MSQLDSVQNNITNNNVVKSNYRPSIKQIFVGVIIILMWSTGLETFVAISKIFDDISTASSTNEVLQDSKRPKQSMRSMRNSNEQSTNFKRRTHVSDSTYPHQMKNMSQNSSSPSSLPSPPSQVMITPQEEWLQTPWLPYPEKTIPNNVESCPDGIDFPLFIKTRRKNWLDKDYLERNGLWQRNVDDKLGTYVFAKANGLRVPEIYYCTSDGPDGLKQTSWLPEKQSKSSSNNSKNNKNKKGFVIKDMEGHSAHGVYVMEQGFGGKERLTQETMTQSQIVRSLEERNAKRIYAEELMQGEIEGQVPYDYKFYMFDGQVGAIAVIANRGSDRFCHMWLDEHWNRLDQLGCFEPAEVKKNSTLPLDACHPFVPDGNDNRPLCASVPKPKQLKEMVSMAKELSKKVGIFFRIDLFESPDGEVILGEFTNAPSKGHFHCASRLDGSCIDTCFLGRMWKEGNEKGKKGNMEGGPTPPEPVYLKGWDTKSTKDKCDIVMSINRGDYDFKAGKIRRLPTSSSSSEEAKKSNLKTTKSKK